MKTTPPDEQKPKRELNSVDRVILEGESADKVNLVKHSKFMLDTLQADMVVIILVKNDRVEIATSLPERTPQSVSSEITVILGKTIKDYIERKTKEKQEGGG